MKIDIRHNLPNIQAAYDRAAKQVPFALAKALNETAASAKTNVQKEMRKVFNRPTNWVINSLRIKYASKSKLSAELAFKDKNSVESSRSMLEPHIFGGKRRHKTMETRLTRRGILPMGWHVVPGGGAKLDAYGNMSRGEISLILNVLGTYTELGYNKANAATRARMAKGNVKKGVYGYELWINPVGGKAKHIPPGIYKRVATPFGSSLKPMLIFVRSVSYKQTLGFFPIVNATAKKEFSTRFDVAFDKALQSAFYRVQGSLL
jgi:hypothetical protein